MLEQLTSPDFSWKVHPARERWKAALFAAAVIAGAAWLAAELMEHPGWGLFAALVLVVGSNRFLFPTNYELTEDAVTARYPLKTVRYPWSEIRRFVFDETGGFLSPRAKPSFLDEYRGISVLFGERLCGNEGQTNHDPLTLALALSPQGRGDKAAIIVHEIRRRLPRDAIIHDVAQSKNRMAGVERSEPPDVLKEPTSCGG